METVCFTDGSVVDSPVGNYPSYSEFEDRAKSHAHRTLCDPHLNGSTFVIVMATLLQVARTINYALSPWRPDFVPQRSFSCIYTHQMHWQI